MNPDLSQLPVCNENWETMERLPEGRRMCHRCAHPLTDFRGMSKAEITLAHVMSDERVCGVYSPEQLAPVSPAQPRRCRSGLVTLALGASLLAARAEAQTTAPPAGQEQAPAARDTAAARQIPASAATDAAPAPQPTLVVRGHVRDSASGAPIRYALVMVEGTARRTPTDSTGGYVLRIPTDGAKTLRLRFGAIGYTTATRDVEQAAGEIEVDVTLHVTVIGLVGIVANDTPKRDDRERVGYHVTRIEGSRP